VTPALQFSSDADVDAFVAEFEACTLTHDRWTHAAHVSVASAYSLQFGDHALDRMRDGIQRLNAVHGVEQTLTGGYHETLTVVWMRLVRRALTNTAKTDERWRRINAAIEVLADKKLTLSYYSREAIMSPTARYGWLEPDITPLP